MRGFSILLIAAMIGAGANAQPRVDEKPRFGIVPNYDLYPQDTPKAALESATKLLENRRYDYFLAQVVDADLLAAKLQDRAARIEREVELQLLDRREEQKKNLVNSRDRLPVEPKEFAAAVREEALNRSFKYIVRDLQAHLAEYPENVKVFRRYFSEGQVADAGTTASFSHKDFPGKGVYLKNNGKRWYLLDQQSEEPKPTTEK